MNTSETVATEVTEVTCDVQGLNPVPQLREFALATQSVIDQGSLVDLSLVTFPPREAFAEDVVSKHDRPRGHHIGDAVGLQTGNGTALSASGTANRTLLLDLEQHQYDGMSREYTF